MNFPIDHDLHCHTYLSNCCSDEQQLPSALLMHARQNGYTVQCVTDHLWDAAVPGASSWYAPQDIEHVRQNLPMPRDEQVRMVFGCETEFCGGRKMGLHPSHYDAFDFIVIPPNHFHMKNFVRPDCYDTEEKIADLVMERLEQLCELDLPWRKVGIAHLNCSLMFKEGDHLRVMELVDEQRFRSVMRKLAQWGAGIELNLACFKEGWQAQEDKQLRLFRLAKQEGCKFFLASDAHTVAALDRVPQRSAEVCARLGLTAQDCFRLA